RPRRFRFPPPVTVCLSDGGTHGRAATDADRGGVRVPGGPPGVDPERDARRGAPDAHPHLPRVRGPPGGTDCRAFGQTRAAGVIAERPGERPLPRCGTVSRPCHGPDRRSPQSPGDPRSVAWLGPETKPQHGAARRAAVTVS